MNSYIVDTSNAEIVKLILHSASDASHTRLFDCISGVHLYLLFTIRRTEIQKHAKPLLEVHRWPICRCNVRYGSDSVPFGFGFAARVGSIG